jgi:AcrR family transcriptional regulator
MGIKERKEREREQQKELILNAASEIVAEQGIEKLSIRRLADKIEYSPAIIYHYFKDKDDIVSHLMKTGYQKIIYALSSVKVLSDKPEDKLKELTRNYIYTALKMPEEFKNIQLDNSPAILEFTSSMFKGVSKKKPALAILAECLKDIYKEKNLDDSMIELTSQVIAASTLGLTIKLIIENVDEMQRNILIEHFIKCTVDGLVLGKFPYSN